MSGNRNAKKNAESMIGKAKEKLEHGQEVINQDMRRAGQRVKGATKDARANLERGEERAREGMEHATDEMKDAMRH
ncbi:hypothetical protein ACWDOP_31800 [Nocardia sp. NPDC003693]